MIAVSDRQLEARAEPSVQPGFGIGRRRDRGMSALAARHDAVAAAIPADAPVAFLDVPLTTNVGDLLIMEGTLAFFAKHQRRVRLSRTLHNTPERGRLRIHEGDTIVLQGGGNFGDLYPHIQGYRERIVREYPDHKVVILPQTIYYEDRDALARSAEQLNRHPDLTLFVRDAASEALARPFFGERLALAPDMAHQLWPDLHDRVAALPGTDADAAPLYFMRRDDERGHDYRSFDAARSSFVDWQNLVPFSLRLRNRVLRELATLESRQQMPWSLEDSHFAGTRASIHAIAARLAAHPAWITSRLHGCILGLLLDKPFAAIDNSYGKIASYLDTWKDWLDPVVRVTNEHQAAEVQRLFATDRPQDRDDLWRRYQDLSAGLDRRS